jgi:hypothetical protein
MTTHGIEIVKLAVISLGWIYITSTFVAVGMSGRLPPILLALASLVLVPGGITLIVFWRRLLRNSRAK